MPSVTLPLAADVATTSSGLGAGAGPHLPVGTWSGTRYRSALRFQNPSWSAWTAITKATLTFYISDHAHVGVRNSSIYVRKQTIANLWTKGSGSQNCNSGFSGSNTTQYDDIDPNSTDQVSFSSGTTANAKKTVTVTAQVQYYWANNASVLVFVFDQNDSSDYTELWSEDKTGGYNAELTIDYVVQSPPTAPSLVDPNDEDVAIVRPTFTWTHHDPQGDPQTAADIEVYNGATLLTTLHPATPTGNTAVCDVDLPRGVQLQWRARTSDAGGVGAWSGYALFAVLPLPVVTIDPTRAMEFAAGAPRLRVNWTNTNGGQTKYRVQAGAFDSGWLAGSVQSYVLSSVALVDNTPVSITVSVDTGGTTPLVGSASRSFTPRYGLTVHRRDLTAAPINWGSPVVVSTVPSGASLPIEYGSDTAANAVPSSGWLPDLASVPKRRYLFWRAWFIPSATQGPTLDKITIPTDSTATLVDKWGTTRDTPGLTGVWSIDPGEAVYGTRSMRADVTGAGPFKVYSYGVKVRAGRSYVLTGLMKSNGNSGAQFRLEDGAGNILQGGGLSLPTGNVESAKITATGVTDWFNPAKNDTVRYRTPVYVADSDKTVYVVLVAGGTSGAIAWFDAIKLEESTVATPWSPGAIGAVVVDAGGVQVDGNRGGVLRYKGTDGGARSVVGGGTSGLLFAGDTELASPADGILTVDGLPLLTSLLPVPGHTHIWTPGATGTGVPTFSGQGSGTFTNATFEWVQIGKIVVIRLAFTINANGSGSSGVGVTCAGAPAPANAFSIPGDRGGTGVQRMLGRVGSGAFNLASITVVSTGGTSSVTGADLASGAAYGFQGAYIATTDVPPTIT